MSAPDLTGESQILHMTASSMAVVAQLVEHSVVVRTVVGSSPIDRPITPFDMNEMAPSRSESGVEARPECHIDCDFPSAMV